MGLLSAFKSTLDQIPVLEKSKLMLTRKVQRNLDTMMQDPNFRLTGKGDTFFATAPGHRAKRVMFQGDVTPAGQWM